MGCGFTGNRGTSFKILVPVLLTQGSQHFLLLTGVYASVNLISNLVESPDDFYNQCLVVCVILDPNRADLTGRSTGNVAASDE